MSAQDEHWMGQVLEMANRPPGCLLPNPRVAALIVHQNRVVGQGIHQGPGQAHAERLAIEDAEDKHFRRFDEADLYINLEPCCHKNKRTAACLPLVLDKQFRRIVIAHKDPNPQVRGKSIRRLKKTKSEVRLGCLKEKAILLNQAFIKNQIEQKPYVTLKLALSYDGKLALDTGKSKWITGTQARRQVHKLRDQVDSIALGRKSFEHDQPRLTVRLPRKRTTKKILIFGTPNQAQLKARTDLNRIWLAPSSEKKTLRSVQQLAVRKKLSSSLKLAYRQAQMHHLLLEGGAELASSFLEQDQVDEIHLFYGRGFLGGQGRYSLGQNWNIKTLSKAISFAPRFSKIVGSDLHVYGRKHLYRPLS